MYITQTKLLGRCPSPLPPQHTHTPPAPPPPGQLNLFNDIIYVNANAAILEHVNIHAVPHLGIYTSPTDVPRPTDGSVSVMALNESGKVRVTWSRPTEGPIQMITGYSVLYRRRGTTSYTTHSVSDSSTISYTISNLNLGTMYEVRVASVGPLGRSGYCCEGGKRVTTYNSECTLYKEAFCECKDALSCSASNVIYLTLLPNRCTSTH